MDSAERVLNSPGQVTKQLAAVLDRYPGLNLAILYGSYAAGTQRPDSDVDLAIAVDARTPVPADTLLELSLEAGKKLKKQVQVRDLSKARGVFLKQILVNGVTVMQKDPTVRAELIIRMLDFTEDMLANVRRIRKRSRERLIAGQ